MNNYIEWLNDPANFGYSLLTWILFVMIIFVLCYIFAFILNTIEKNDKVDKLEEEIKELKGQKKKGKK